MFDPNKPQHWEPVARLPQIKRHDVTGDVLQKALEGVISEFWTQEQEDFNRNPSKDHPYLDLRKIHAWLYGN